MSERLSIRDDKGKLPTSDRCRELFEMAVKASPALLNNLPLEPVVRGDGGYDGYKDMATDFAFVGFAIGLRMAKRALDTGEIEKVLLK